MNAFPCSLLDAVRSHDPARPVMTVIDGGETLTFGDLVGLAERQRRALADIGVRSGDAIAAALPSGPGFAALLLACWQSGVRLTIVDPRRIAALVRCDPPPKFVVIEQTNAAERGVRRVAIDDIGHSARPWVRSDPIDDPANASFSVVLDGVVETIGAVALLRSVSNCRLLHPFVGGETFVSGSSALTLSGLFLSLVLPLALGLHVIRTQTATATPTAAGLDGALLQNALARADWCELPGADWVTLARRDARLLIPASVRGLLCGSYMSAGDADLVEARFSRPVSRGFGTSEVGLWAVELGVGRDAAREDGREVGPDTGRNAAGFAGRGVNSHAWRGSRRDIRPDTGDDAGSSARLGQGVNGGPDDERGAGLETWRDIGGVAGPVYVSGGGTVGQPTVSISSGFGSPDLRVVSAGRDKGHLAAARRGAGSNLSRSSGHAADYEDGRGVWRDQGSASGRGLLPETGRLAGAFVEPALRPDTGCDAGSDGLVARPDVSRDRERGDGWEDGRLAEGNLRHAILGKVGRDTTAEAGRGAGLDLVSASERGVGFDRDVGAARSDGRSSGSRAGLFVAGVRPLRSLLRLASAPEGSRTGEIVLRPATGEGREVRTGMVGWIGVGGGVEVTGALSDIVVRGGAAFLLSDWDRRVSARDGVVASRTFREFGALPTEKAICVCVSTTGVVEAQGADAAAPTPDRIVLLSPAECPTLPEVGVLRLITSGKGARATITAVTGRRFRRSPAYNQAGLAAAVERALLRDEALDFLMLWGCGRRRCAAGPDRAAIDALGDLLAAAEAAAPLGARVHIVCTDGHAANNGHSVSHYSAYFEAVESLAKGLDARFELESSVWRRGGLTREHVLALEREPDFQARWERFPLQTRFIEQAGRHSAQVDKVGAARHYYATCLLEREVLKTLFAGSVFLTYNGPDFNACFPDLPTLYIYPGPRGRTDKPWFVDADIDQDSAAVGQHLGATVGAA